MEETFQHFTKYYSLLDKATTISVISTVGKNGGLFAFDALTMRKWMKMEEFQMEIDANYNDLALRFPDRSIHLRKQDCIPKISPIMTLVKAHRLTQTKISP